MYEVVPLEFMEDEFYDITSANGAYQGKAVFEGEAFADEMIADERRWRENIDRGIEEIKRMRKRYMDAKERKYKHLMRQLEEEIAQAKDDLKAIIKSRDYIY